MSEVVHPDALKPELHADVCPGSRQVLSTQRRTARTGQDRVVRSGAHEVTEVILERIAHKGRPGLSFFKPVKNGRLLRFPSATLTAGALRPDLPATVFGRRAVGGPSLSKDGAKQNA
jgi:hypothetical protein